MKFIETGRDGREDGTGGGGVLPFRADPCLVGNGEVCLPGTRGGFEFKDGMDSPVETGELSSALSKFKWACFGGDRGVSTRNEGGDFGGENVLNTDKGRCLEEAAP